MLLSRLATLETGLRGLRGFLNGPPCTLVQAFHRTIQLSEYDVQNFLADEFRLSFRAQDPENGDPDRPDPNALQKSELILSKVVLLNKKATEPDLTVKLADGLEIRNED